MADKAGHTQARSARALAALMAIALAALLLAVAPACAHADGGVTLTGMSDGVGGDLQSVDPSLYVALSFDKNVSWAKGGDDSFVRENANKIHLRTADGRDVPGATVVPGGDEESRRVFFIEFHERLAPVTDYQVVVDAGVRAANGEDVSEEECVAWFKTSPEVADGVTVWQVAVAAAAAVCVAAGVAAQAVRQRRRAS